MHLEHNAQEDMQIALKEELAAHNDNLAERTRAIFEKKEWIHLILLIYM